MEGRRGVWELQMAFLLDFFVRRSASMDNNAVGVVGTRANTWWKSDNRTTMKKVKVIRYDVLGESEVKDENRRNR